MELRSVLLAAGGLSLLSLSSVESTPSDALIKDIEKVISSRFADTNTNRFGISRLGEPYNTHKYKGARVMKSVSEAERKIVDQLNESDWNAVVYTTSPPQVTKPRTPISDAGIPPVSFGRHLRNYNGPAFLTTPAKELPHAGTANEELLPFTEAVRKGERTSFSYKGWSFLARKVLAEETCVACHQDSKGKPVKVGTVIGYYLMGFKKKDNP